MNCVPCSSVTPFAISPATTSAAPARRSVTVTGAARVVAGLMAKGVTEIYETSYIDRGYEHIEEKLRSLGAEIRREKL